MADESLLARSTEDAIQEPQKYQSSALIAAATNLKFEAKEGKKGSAGAGYADVIQQCHTKTKEEVIQDFNSDGTQGLTEAKIEAARNKYGWNELTPAYEHPWWVKLLLSIFGGFFNQLLWVGSILCFISYGVRSDDPTNLYLGVTLAVVVTITGIFGYFQESKSADIMASFSKFRPKDTIVVRGGVDMPVGARDLVPGDLVSLKNGSKIPADIRIIAQMQMKVDNASLTGESEAQERSWLPDEGLPIESKNIVFFGTLIVNGNGTGVVVATGDNTYMGQVAKLAQSTENVETPIALEINAFVKKISGIAFFLGFLFFILGYLKNPSIVDAVILLIGIIVANVPEGLLATVTVSLTLTANRMGKKNVQVKNLESVETLGSTSVICSDKTGTLTTSIMTVAHVYFDGRHVEADTTKPFNAIKEVEEGSMYEDGDHYASFKRLLRIGVLCNNCTMTNETDHLGNPQVLGDATETAIFKFCDGHVSKMNPNWNTNAYRDGHKKLHEIPFNSKNKWQTSIHKKVRGEFKCGPHEDDEKAYETRPIVVLKGAPERVLNMCTSYLENGEKHELNEEMRKKFMEDVLVLGRQGERVLAFADQELDPEEFDVSLPEPVLRCHNGHEDKRKAGQKGHVWVKFEDDFYEVECTAEKDGQRKTVEKHTFGDIYRLFAEQMKMKPGSIRMNIATSEDLLEYDVTLQDMQLGDNAVIHASKGPYKFMGSSRENANWSFGLNGDEGLTFVGLYAMIDPARPGVPEAVMKCQDAGIKVIMVTGDHPVTAHAIAKKVNIVAKDRTTGEYHMTKQEVAEKRFGDESRKDDIAGDDPDYRAALVPGWVLQEMEDNSDEATMVRFWNEVLTKESIVFARTSPEQKLKIVAACQQRGGVVAVTGDGVNDSPALKKADIGVAMGITGTDVAKESADMILKDDNFASIVNGVEEGRIIFDNLKKSIAYTLSSNIPEITPFLFYTLAAIPLPLTTVMILLVDLGTDLAPAISLAHEEAESDIMERAPRDQNRDKLVTWSLVSFAYLQIGMLQFLAGFYAYFVVLWSYGLYPLDLVNLDADNLYPYMAANQDYQQQGYWLYCLEDKVGIRNPANDDDDLLTRHRNCFYAPDPSVFDCFWDGTSLDAGGDAGTATECTATPTGQTYDLANNLASFKDWFKKGEDYYKDTRRVVDRVISLESFEGMSTCGAGGAAQAGATTFNACAKVCLDDNTCAGFSFAGSCQTFTSCDGNVATGKGSEPKAYKFNPAASKAGYSRTDLKTLLADFQGTEANEVKGFAAYSKALYKMISRHDYLKTFDAYDRRPCYGDRDYYNMGARYLQIPKDGTAGVTCTLDDKQKPWDYQYWVPGNRPCSMLNYCYNVKLESAVGQTIGSGVSGNNGQNAIYPMEMYDRSYALAQSNTAYFISIIVVQWADLMICKTRVRSLFEQGMTNVFMNYALLFETVLGAVLVYIPFANTALGTKPMQFVWWLPAVPFSIMIYIYDEFRKGYIRYYRKPHDGKEATGCWLERNTYW